MVYDSECVRYLLKINEGLGISPQQTAEAIARDLNKEKKLAVALRRKNARSKDIADLLDKVCGSKTSSSANKTKNAGKYTVYYSVENCGDGSAYPRFFLDEECAEVHQELLNLDDGWAEPCTGSLEVYSASPVKFEAMSREEYLQELRNEVEEYDSVLKEHRKAAIERLEGGKRKKK